MFKKNETQPVRPRERAPIPSRTALVDGAISIIGPGMTVVGDVVTEGIVRVEGEVRGTIRAGKAVILGQSGRVLGDIFTEDAVIGGNIDGSILANNRLELQSTCFVTGEIRTRGERLKLEEGARFSGQVHMLEEEIATELTVDEAAPTDLPRIHGAYSAYDEVTDSETPELELEQDEEAMAVGQSGGRIRAASNR